VANGKGRCRCKVGPAFDIGQPSRAPYILAPVISVIAKDTKLSVLEQRRRWVKVINPETSESGWVYGAQSERPRKIARLVGYDWSAQEKFFGTHRQSHVVDMEAHGALADRRLAATTFADV
jgi:TPP-dependent indolepyruvate ferredoxin oxidoreductase alpha subunit